MVDVVNDVIINYESQNFDKAAGDIKQMSVSLDGLVVASSSSEKATASLENRFKSLERQLSTSAGNADKYAKVQDTVNKAVAQNPEMIGRGNEVLAAAAQKYGLVEKAALSTGAAFEQVTAKTKLQRYEMLNISRQLQDVAVSLYSGQNPLTVAVQQGSQIFDVSQSSGVGLISIFKQVAAAGASMVTPITASIAGVVALTAAAAALAVQYDKVQVSSQKALIGAGARTGTTVSDLNQFTAQNSGFSATGLSNKEARALGEDLTATGDIVISKLHGMSDAVVGFSNQTGKSMDDARKSFVKFADDPKKGLEELSNVFGELDGDTRRLVEDFIQAGDKTGAFNAIIDALAGKSKNAAENMGFFEKVARSVGNFLGTETFKPSGTESQIDNVKKQLNDALASFESAPNGAYAGVFAKQIELLSQKLVELQQKAEAVHLDRIATETSKLSTEAEQADRALIPEIGQIEKLIETIGKLERARAAGVTGMDSERDAAALQAAQNQLAALVQTEDTAARYQQRVAEISQAWGNVGQSVALQLQQMQNALPVAEAWTNATKMRAQYEATYLDLIDRGLTKQEASAVAAKQQELSQAAAVASAQKTVQASEDNLAKIRAQGTGMEGVVASSIAYRDAIQAGATYTQAAAISANTLEASMIQAAQAADQLAVNTANAKTAADFAFVQKNGQFAPTSGNANLSSSIPTVYGPDGRLYTATTTDQFALAYNQQQYGTIDGLPLRTDQRNSIQAYTTGIVPKTTSAASGSTTAASAITAPISNLTSSIDNLNTSTKQLNTTNSELLSPYYTQDPRTSHIGFRSQGMADGGYVDVPGGISANDNMIATIPVASGERIYVDAMPGRRGGGGNTTISISMPVVIQGNATPDQVGRTLYQAAQTTAKQLAVAGR